MHRTIQWLIRVMDLLNTTIKIITLNLRKLRNNPILQLMKIMKFMKDLYLVNIKSMLSPRKAREDIAQRGKMHRMSMKIDYSSFREFE